MASVGFDDDDDDADDGFWARAGSVLDAVEESLTQRRRGDETATTTKATTNARGTTRGDDGTTASEELRQMLIERDARLGMLRSKLDMVERENENLKRNGASASGDGGGGARGGAGEVNYGAVGGANGANARAAPTSTNAASVVAKAEVQDLKQQLATLRSKLAFKEEEITEARRLEDDARAKLRAANDERTKLAAEVRAERRARASAGQKRPSRDESQETAANKRQRTGGASGGDVLGSEARVGERTTGMSAGGSHRRAREGLSVASPPETLALALPMAPPDVAATLYQRGVSGYYSSDNVFARLMNDVPLDVSSFLAKPNESSVVSAELVNPVRAALMNLATNPDSTVALTRALVESIVETSNSITSSAHYAHVTSILRILSALAMIDGRSLSIVLGACGAQRNQTVATVTAHGAPPASLAGIPGLGGAGMGTLVAHPRAHSGRIFVPASMSSTNHASAPTPKPTKTTKSRLSGSQGGEAPEVAPFLETLIQLLTDAKCDGQWRVVDAVIVALIRFASGVGVENGRGAFGAVAQKHSGFGSCLKSIAPNSTRFLALMLIRMLAPTPEFQSFLCEPLDVERGIEKPPTPERRKRATLFAAILSCLRADCVEENGLIFVIKSSYVAHATPEQSGTLQEAALRVLRTLAFIGWSEYGAAAVAVNALDVLAAVAVEEYVSPLPVAHSKSSTALHQATRLVHALLDEHYDAHLPRLLGARKSQRVIARLAHLSSASGGGRESRMADWLGRILLKVRE